MSYAAAPALQRAVFERLTIWPGLAGVAIYDAVPPVAAGTWMFMAGLRKRGLPPGGGEGKQGGSAGADQDREL